MIDWDFIAQLEGGTLRAIVPDAAHSESGATFQGGIDIANMPKSAWEVLPDDLRAKLTPYRELKGIKAQHFLGLNPIVISIEERNTLQAACAAVILAKVRGEYLERSPSTTFDQIPDAAQTVIFSVCWQYGDPWQDAKCGEFWTFSVTRRWSAVHDYLAIPLDPNASGSFFPDRRYATRRRREAAYLKEKLNL